VVREIVFTILMYFMYNVNCLVLLVSLILTVLGCFVVDVKYDEFYGSHYDELNIICCGEHTL